jgi:peptidoglycan/xylan/chitin deacetylase (PgdA/CDA1 family)
VILAYHRVASPPSDPQLLAVPPSRFEEQLAALRAHFDPASLSGLAEALESGRRPAGVVLTFDDGYGDNLHEALPLLERYDWPATVFVTTGYVGGAREFWWDELERIVLVPSQLPDTLSLTVCGRRRTWDTRVSSDGPSSAASAWNLEERWDPSARHSTYRALCSAVRGLMPVDRESLLEDLRSWAGVERNVRPSNRPLAEGELDDLSTAGLVEIGAHSEEHPALASLPVAAQQKEIDGSKRFLEDRLGRKVEHFAYPFGRGRWPRRTYGRDSVKLVRDAGYAAACSLKPAVRLGSGLYELPRLIVRDWDGDELIRRIRTHLPAWSSL